jgi:hypothetical protein
MASAWRPRLHCCPPTWPVAPQRMPVPRRRPPSTTRSLRDDGFPGFATHRRLFGRGVYAAPVASAAFRSTCGANPAANALPPASHSAATSSRRLRPCLRRRFPSGHLCPRAGGILPPRATPHVRPRRRPLSRTRTLRDDTLPASPSDATDVRCSMFDVRRSTFDVRCSMFDVRCSMFDVRCSMLDVRCWTFDVGRSTFPAASMDATTNPGHRDHRPNRRPLRFNPKPRKRPPLGVRREPAPLRPARQPKPANHRTPRPEKLHGEPPARGNGKELERTSRAYGRATEDRGRPSVDRRPAAALPTRSRPRPDAATAGRPPLGPPPQFAT